MLEKGSRYARISLPVAVILLGVLVYVSQYQSITTYSYLPNASFKTTSLAYFLKQYRLENWNETGLFNNATRANGFPHAQRHTSSQVTADDNANNKDGQFFDFHYFTKFKSNANINCNALFENNQSEIQRSIEITTHILLKDVPAEMYITMTSNCSSFTETRGYIMSPLTQVEEAFPVAYSILMYKDVEQFERLLRAIYRPQNVYCIHVDIKAEEDVYNATKGIASCFQNVFLVTDRLSVNWGEFSVLEADLICLRELWNHTKKWKYFINLTGQEFPLRTNYELVQVLTAYRGANDVSATIEGANPHRWSMAGDPPHNITPIKGSVHVALSRDFVDFMLHDQRSLDLLNWTKNTQVPDETYFTTLNHNPHLGAPGSYKGEPETTLDDRKPYVVRFKNWGNSVYDWPCYGQRVRMICVFGSGDLPLLSQRRELFANKFYWNYQHALDCMEELVFNRTRDQYLGKLTFDSSWYAQLGFVKNQTHLDLS